MIKSIFSKAIIRKVFSEMVRSLGGRVYVWDGLDQLIWDSDHGLDIEENPIENLVVNESQLTRLPLIVGRETIGYIASIGTTFDHLQLLKDWLDFSLAQEWQKQAITRDALEKYEEINFLYDISQSMAYCLNIREVGTLVIEEINRLLPFSQATILLLNKNSGVLERIPEVDAIIHAGQTDTLPNAVSTEDGIIGIVMNTGRAELVNEVDKDQRYLLYKFHHQSLAKSILCVPLKTRQRVIGVIYLDALTSYAYTAKDMTMVLALSFQAALSMENVQFYHQQVILEQERNTLAEQMRSDYARELEKSVDARTKEFYQELEERQRAVAILRSQNFILEKIVTNNSLKQILSTILEFVELYADGALGCVMLVEIDDQQRRVLRSIAAPSIPETYSKAVDGMLIGPDIGSCGNAAYWGKLTITPDISIDPKWTDVRSIALSHGLRACWSRPIFTTGGEVLGTLAFYYQTPRSPTAAEFDLLERAGHLAQIAIERNLAEKRLRQAKEKAEVASRAKSEFLANMGHDLRTPLNAILGFTQLLLQEEINPKQIEHLHIINRSGEHLLDMINDILEVSKLEAGRLNVRLSPFNLQAMLANLKAKFLPTAQVKQIYLRLEVDPKVPRYIISDQEKLQKSLTNLLDNALKFTELGGVTLRVNFIDISADGTDSSQTNLEHPNKDHNYYQLEFTVEDTGIGIAPEAINDLFDVFTRSRVKEGGTGLGLAISRRFIDLLGGKLEVQSQFGAGASFYFQIQIQLAGTHAESVTDDDHNNGHTSDELVLDQMIDPVNNYPLELPTIPSSAIIESEQYDIASHRQPTYAELSTPSLPSLADLRSVDPNWLREVHHATMQINGNRVNQLLEQLSHENVLLSNQIKALVNGFRFDLLLKIFNDFFSDPSYENLTTAGIVSPEDGVSQLEVSNSELENVSLDLSPADFSRISQARESKEVLLTMSAPSYESLEDQSNQDKPPIISSESILIVEPSLVHRHLLQKMLEYLGYQTKAVTSLKEGFEILLAETMIITFVDLEQLINYPDALTDMTIMHPEMLLVGLSNLSLTELKQCHAERIKNDSSILAMFDSLNDYLIKPINLQKITNLMNQWQPLLKPHA